MQFEVSKPKTGKGRGYILKSSVLQNALKERNVAVSVYIDFFTPQYFNPDDTSVFEAVYIPVSIGGTENRFHIRIGVVAAEQRKHVEQLFLKTALDPFLKFVDYQLAKPKNSTDGGRGFYVKWAEGKLVF